jgi:hypothetical protein
MEQKVKVRTILPSISPTCPSIASPNQVTLLEEDKISAYYGGGVSRQEPQLLMPLGQAWGATLPMLILGAIVAGLLMLTAFIQARATVYTVTNRRVAMRIGAALTVTLNLPYTQIANAMLDLRKSGTGTIAFEIMGKTRFGFLILWPHARPWYIAQPQPALRCIPDAEKVAAMISDAAEARVSVPKVVRRNTPAAAAVAAE